jgi:flagellar hook protein FlgE
MSINSAMQAGVSGLSANSEALAAISDNIANVNTVGYKNNNISFESLVTGDGGPGSAGGVTTSALQTVSAQGTLTQTSSPTDIAITGNGMFVVTPSASSVNGSTPLLYTRAGSFTPNAQGFLQNSAGLYLQGWPANALGVVTPNPSDLNSLTPINVNSVGGTVTPTSAATVNANLKSSQPVSTQAADAEITTDAAWFNTAAGHTTVPALSAAQQAAVDAAWATLSASQQANATAAAAALPSLQIAAQGASLQALTPAQITAQMTASAATSAYNPVTNSMTAYDPTTGTGVQPDFTVQIPVLDSLGGQHTIQVDFLKAGTANQWFAEVQAVPTSDVVSGSGLAQGQLASGTVSFNSDGTLNLTNSNLASALNIGASSATAPAAGAVNWATALDVSASPFTLTLAPGSGASGLTQLNSTSVIESVDSNGARPGNLSSVSIDSSGEVTATFDNGTSKVLAQVALATFLNPDGLTSVSGNAYESNPKAGNVSLKVAGTGGAGTLTSNALEASTVDLSSQFTNLIITQRAYTASSKVITAADQMTQDLLSIIR